MLLFVAIKSVNLTIEIEKKLIMLPGDQSPDEKHIIFPGYPKKALH